MKKSMTVAIGAAILMALPSLAVAGSTNANPNLKTAPGQIQKHSTTGARAQDYAPGQLQKNSTTGARATDFAPGQVKKRN